MFSHYEKLSAIQQFVSTNLSLATPFLLGYFERKPSDH